MFKLLTVYCSVYTVLHKKNRLDPIGSLLSRSWLSCSNSILYQDIADTLSTEVAEDSIHVAKLRSALESVDAKRRKVRQLIELLLLLIYLISK